MRDFEIINHELCLSVNTIAKAMGIALKSALETIKKGVYRNRKGDTSYRHYADPNDARVKWIAYDSLPDMSRARVDHYYGDVWMCFYRQQFISQANTHIDIADFGYFARLKVKKGGKAYSSSEAKDLALGCGWMRMLNERDFFDVFQSKKMLYFSHAAQVLSTQSIYGLKVKSGRVLSRRVKQWQADGRDSMVSGHIGNSNRRKLTDIGLKLILDLYSNPIKPTAKAVAKLYNQTAIAKGWENITTERVRQILNEPRHKSIVYLSRHGEAEDRKAHERTIKRRRPSFPDALWSLDGFTVQLRYQDEEGKTRSGLYGVGILDIHSDALVGYAVGDGETAVLVQAALRDATRKTMMRPYQLQYDNSSANKSHEVTQLMSNISRVNFPCQPYNGKAKPIENWIGRMERLNLRYYPNFKGGNITSPSLTIKANADFLAAQSKAGTLPTKAGAIAQFKKAVEVHNDTVGVDGKTPNERYQMTHAKRRKMDYLTMVECFWVERRKKARYTKDGLQIEVDKTRLTYEVESTKGVEDFEFRNQYLGDMFSVKYDPDDLSEINLYSGETWVATAAQKYEAPMAVADYAEGEGKIIHAALEEREAVRRRNRTKLETAREDLAEEGVLIELSHELLHKDAYNRAEQRILDSQIDTAARVISAPKSRKRVTLYDVDEEEGRLIE